jgi:hypothetical protein
MHSARCPECDYDLRGLPCPHRCPECGTPYDERTYKWRARNRLPLLVLAIGTIPVFEAVVDLGRSWAGRRPVDVWRLVSSSVGVGAFALIGIWLWRTRRQRWVAITPEGVRIRWGDKDTLVRWTEIDDIAICEEGVIRRGDGVTVLLHRANHGPTERIGTVFNRASAEDFQTRAFAARSYYINGE